VRFFRCRLARSIASASFTLMNAIARATASRPPRATSIGKPDLSLRQISEGETPVRRDHARSVRVFPRKARVRLCTSRRPGLPGNRAWPFRKRTDGGAAFFGASFAFICEGFEVRGVQLLRPLRGCGKNLRVINHPGVRQLVLCWPHPPFEQEAMPALWMRTVRRAHWICIRARRDRPVDVN
jgi:hypothetical protein